MTMTALKLLMCRVVDGQPVMEAAPEAACGDPGATAVGVLVLAFVTFGVPCACLVIYRCVPPAGVRPCPNAQCRLTCPARPHRSCTLARMLRAAEVREGVAVELAVLNRARGAALPPSAESPACSGGGGGGGGGGAATGTGEDEAPATAAGVLGIGPSAAAVRAAAATAAAAEVYLEPYGIYRPPVRPWYEAWVYVRRGVQCSLLVGLAANEVWRQVCARKRRLGGGSKCVCVYVCVV
jgi:hypothetical protein